MTEFVQSSFTNDALLDLLDEERNRFMKADEGKMRQIVDLLIARGVYPTEPVPGNPTRDVFRMVDGYGARWHEWQEPLECPHCASDLRDIQAGPPFKREIGISVNDRCAYYKCPDCGKRIERANKVHRSRLPPARHLRR